MTESDEKLIEEIARELSRYTPFPIAAASAALAVVRKHEGWQPIETAPKETEVLLYSENLGMAVHPVEAIAAFGWEDITHWRPLIEPPA